MNAVTYQEQCARTWNTNDPERLQLCNAALGLVGELGEFVRRPSVDELGDCYYYVVTLARMIGGRGEHVDLATWSDVRSRKDSADHVAATEAGEAALRAASRVAEWVKKLCFHDKPDAVTDIALCLERASDEMMVAAHELAVTPSAVMQQNIDKLRARYPDGFVEGGGIRG